MSSSSRSTQPSRGSRRRMSRLSQRVAGVRVPPVRDMERFWDARAREDPYYFVDSRLRYQAPDEEAFWAGGVQALATLLSALRVEIPQGSVALDVGCGLGRL